MADQLLPFGYDTIVIDGGWSGSNVDAYGRPVPNIDNWPSAADGKGFKPLADFAHGLGLKFGVWRIRGTSKSAVENKCEVLNSNPKVTIDEVVFDQTKCDANPAANRWCRCTWDQSAIGINASHPAAQAYYDSVVDLYATWGVDLIKWDCLYDYDNEFSIEETLALNAVNSVDRPIILSLSPGGSMSDGSAAWIAGRSDGRAPPGSTVTGPKATMYRVTSDFHAKKNHKSGHFDNELGEHAFVIGNLSSFNGKSLIGAANTWPDLDMIDLGRYSEYFGTPTAQLHATMWMMAQVIRLL
jgi:hypothetical protein